MDCFLFQVDTEIHTTGFLFVYHSTATGTCVHPEKTCRVPCTRRWGDHTHCALSIIPFTSYSMWPELSSQDWLRPSSCPQAAKVIRAQVQLMQTLSFPSNSKQDTWDSSRGGFFLEMCPYSLHFTWSLQDWKTGSVHFQNDVCIRTSVRRCTWVDRFPPDKPRSDSLR